MFSFNKAFSILSKDQKKFLFIIFFLSFIAMLLESLSVGIILPMLSILLGDDTILNSPIFNKLISDVNIVYLGLLITLIVFLSKNLYLIFAHYIRLRFINEIIREKSSKIFNFYLRKDYLFFLKKNTAELLRNTRGEVNSFASYLDQCFLFLNELVVLIGIFLVLLFIDTLGTCIIALVSLTFATILYLLSYRKIKKLGKDRIEYEGKLTKHILQGYSSAKEIKILNRESDLISQVKDNLKKYVNINLIYSFISGLPRFLFEILVVVIFLILVLFMINTDRETTDIIKYLGVFAVASFRFIPACARIVSSSQVIMFREASVRLLSNELNNLNPSDDKSNLGKKTIDKIRFNSHIKIRNLSFVYSSRTIPTLSDISLDIFKGEFVGIIGKTGSGKSTLINILTGLLNPSEGSIEVDDINIKKNIKDWQKKIGYVPQSIYLTDESIRKNIAFGIKDIEINDNMVMDAINKANLTLFLKNLPQGLDAIVGEKGIRISGGQQQRIAIARALYHDPEIIIFDEATSSVDINTEKQLIQSIENLKKDKTIIIIAHRLSTIKNCGKVYLVENGKIKKHGLPEEIVSSYKSN